MKKMSSFIFGLLMVSSQLIYAQKLAPTEDKVLVEVFVGDMEEHPRDQDVILFEGKNKGEIYKGISDSLGNIQLLIPEGDVYLIKIAGLGDQQDFSTLFLPKKEGRFTSSFKILYKPSQVFELKGVRFKSGQHTLQNPALKILDNLVEMLLLKDKSRLEIAGHTDNIGDDNKNKLLSQRRAEEVCRYLIKQGVDKNRLVAKGYGEEHPIASNDTDEGRRKNRRTEIRIIQ